MNKYQKARHDSNKLVVSESRKHAKTINQVPQFAQDVETLDSINKKVEEIRIEQEKDTKGITTHKGNTMGNLSDLLLAVAGALFVYAKNNETLKEKVNYKPGTITRMSAADVINASGIVYNEAKNISEADLATVGITPEKLKSFGDLQVYFNGIKNSPREATIDTSGNTEKLKQLFQQSYDLCKMSMDRLAPQFKEIDPDFYLKYKAARNIIYRRNKKEKEEGDTNNMV